MRTPKLLLLSLLSAATPASAISTSDDAFERTTKEAVTRIAQQDGFSGTILLLRGNTVLLRQAEGFADRARQIPNRIDTAFPLESITKQFTAVAILLLVQDGKLSLDDTIATFDPAVPAAWRGITITQLLTHSSGIVDCTCANDNSPSYREYVDRSMEAPLAFPPGSNMLYSNAGYGLLALVIEHVTAGSYGDFIRKRILAPLGMKHSGYGALPKNSALGYIRDARTGQWHEGVGAHMESMAGFGGLYTTVDDLRSWAQALREDRLLSTSSRAAMFQNRGHDYGFGWRFAEKFNRKLVWHTGNDSAAGYATLIDEFPSENLTLIVLSNNSGLTKTTATLGIAGKIVTFPANAAREVVERVETLYFAGRE